jgi:transcriptional regulator with XRE-family HTH domain
MMPGQDERGAFGMLLRRARLRAGMSERDVARRLRVAVGSVHAAESGRDPRLSMLQRLVEGVPGLSPEEVLGRPRPAQVRDLEAAWQLQRRLHGFAIEHLRRTLRLLPAGACEITTELLGMRSLGRGPDAGIAARRMLLAACLATGPRLEEMVERAVAASPRAFHAEHDGRVHELRAGARTSAYRCIERLAAGERESLLGGAAIEPAWLPAPALGVVLEVPVQRLTLAIVSDGGSPVATMRACAWPGFVETSDAEPNLISWLDPRGGPVMREREHGIEAAFARPLAGIAYALVERRVDRVAASRSRIAFQRRPPTVGDVLHEARLRAGLSARELARHAGLAAPTIRATEAGRDPRRSSIVLLLRALPELSPRHVLPASVRDAGSSAASAWEAWRDLAGVEAEAIEMHVAFGDDGWVGLSRRIHGFRALPGRARAMALRMATTRLCREREAIVPGALEIDDDAAADTRTRTLVHGARIVGYQTILARRLLERGVSFNRTSRALAYPAIDGRMPTGFERHPSVSGFATPEVPARRLVVTATFPAALMPSSCRMRVMPATELLDDVERDVAALLPPDSLRLTRSPRRRRLSLEVDRPLPGLRYALLWPSPLEDPATAGWHAARK